MNNYKLLPALISILQTRNLTQSAKDLNVTQSAMSKTLTQIRHAFHDQIVIREGNHFVLTRRGEELMQQLPSLLLQLDNLYLPNVMDPGSCRRKFTFASSDYVAQAVLPAICHNIERQAPHAGIEYLLWQKEQLAELSEHNLDLVSTIAQSIPANIHGKMMAEDQLVAVFRSSHPLSTDQLSIDNYCNARHILISGGGDKDSPVDKALAAAGRSRKIFACVPFFQSAVELLLQTDTMLTTPLHIAADFAQRYDLQIRALPIDIEAQQYYLLWHAKHHHNAEHKWFRELCYPHLKGHLETTISQGMKLLHTSK
ncbi:LysR family transcriptional regulator [Psychromonas aquimarina]|uniref:LysR family transcriptional regulator n=1 Tax=Psychromonas aquimarina TaxID=444919 RepID=UPI000416DCEA|nr:LysR family transcriptional regulator [Psychromonas aquimarina]